jgi:hypothetical protein
MLVAHSLLWHRQRLTGGPVAVEETIQVYSLRNDDDDDDDDDYINTVVISIEILN